MSRFSRLRSRTLVPLALFLALSAGCGPKTTATKPADQGSGRQAVDPWPKLVVALRTDTDATACRQVLAELNSGLAANPSAERPRGPKGDELAKLSSALALMDSEKKFLEQTDYTPLDGHYLSECLFLRDVARSLGVTPADSPEVRSTAAFRWVCRQVVLQPWVLRAANGAMEGKPPLPPGYVLRRGSGSGLERAFTFVALCRQLDLDAYLIGSDASNRPWTYRPASQAAQEYPKGPFWAVGVRVEKDVILFDPWRGEPVPGKTAGRPATLAQVRADPTAVGPWPGEGVPAWDVTADMMRSAEVYLSVPLPALAPRMEMMTDLLRVEHGLKLFVNWDAAVGRAKDAAGEAAVVGWNPKTDGHTPVRGMSAVVGDGSGGKEGAAERDALKNEYDASLIPTDKLGRIPPELKNPDAGFRLLTLAATGYAGVFMQSPTPREKIQRGRYLEATKELVDVRDRFQKAEEFAAGAAFAASAQMKEWFEEANRRYEVLSKARVSRNKDAEVPPAERAVEELWKASQGTLGVVLAGVLARPGAAEATFLLALSFHERAERAQVEADRIGRGTDAEAAKAARGRVAADWGSAVSWWQKYDGYRDAHGGSYPGRAEHTKKLAERANRMAAVK